MSTLIRDAMPSHSRHRSGSAMCGARSCQRSLRKWRHGSGDRVRTCCSRMASRSRPRNSAGSLPRHATRSPELKGLTLHGLRDGGDQPAPRWSVVCADRRHRRHEREDGGALLPQCRHALEQPRRADASGAGDGALVRSPDTRCAR